MNPSTRTRAVLVLLFTGAFLMGSAEMLVVGMLDLIADDLRISFADAGALVTANALGLAIGGPVLTLLATRWDRRRVVIAAPAVFAAFNVILVVAGFEVMLVARVVIGAVQGVFIAAAIPVATSIVPEARRGRAMAIVISGFATASALGLPLGTLLGQAVGWRASFAAVTAVAVLVAVGAIALVPSVPTPRHSGAANQARHAFAPRVLAVLLFCAVLFAGIQTALTYVVPFLGEITHVSGPIVTIFLLLYGIATTVGSYAGGRFADANAGRTLVIGSIGVAASLALLYVGGALPVVAAAAILGMGLFGMGMAPSMQYRVTALAGPGAPLAASLPASAVNGGIALGSLIGGVALDLVDVRTAALAGALIAVVSIGIAAATSRLRSEDPGLAAEPSGDPGGVTSSSVAMR